LVKVDERAYYKHNFIHTAGNAKKEIPNKAQNDAISFPGHVLGTVSP
jgi:hypothetical protein